MGSSSGVFRRPCDAEVYSERISTRRINRSFRWGAAGPDRVKVDACASSSTTCFHLSSARELESRVHALKRDLAHIHATLKMFDPDGEPKTIKPVRPYRPRNRLFEPKELSIRVMTALREADGNTATLDAIVERIMKDKGLNAPAGVVAIALRGLRKRGIAALTEETPPRWGLR
jgi:hypothetical protein